MSNSDYKLILVSDNSAKTQVRYRKKGESLYTTLYLDEKDTDKIIEAILKSLKKKDG